jgi:transcriptional regulator with XRE-family HTH domain
MKLRAVRIARGMTQQELAKKVRMDQGKISRVERGLMDLTVTELVALARALEVHPAELLPDDPDPNDQAA